MKLSPRLASRLHVGQPFSFLLVAAVLVLCVGLGGGTTAYGYWNLVWSDEFDGSSIDTSHWTFDVGNGYWSDSTWIWGWGNNELEYYTSRTQNVYVANGVLHLVARNESYSGFSYTSGRVKSHGLFSKKYGRFEFRAKLPQGQGYWPALWLLPNYPVFPRGQYGNWAASGEIDVMENRGSDPTTVQGTIFYGGEWPGQAMSTQTYTLPSSGQTTEFHTYVLEWSTNSMRWYVDGQLFETQTSWWSSGAAYPAPFDQPFYIIMNLAVGGNYPGNPNVNTVFPGEVQVDYVRVYDYTTDVPALRITSIAREGSDIRVTWTTGSGLTNALQAATGDAGGNYSNNFVDIFAITNTVDPVTNYLDFGAASATSTSRFYRVRLVP
jgi:beta-glucanase (GH16 family)